MSLMDYLKTQFLEIIQWQDDSRDTLSYRYPGMVAASGGVRRYSTILGAMPASSSNCNVFRDLEQRGLW